MKATALFYLSLFLRRIHWFLLIFVAFTAASLTIAQVLPAVYVASTRLLVEAPQIPNQLAAPTVQVSPMEELQVIEQRLMTRVNLLDIARTENVFEDIGDMSADDIVQAMRDSTIIRRSAGNNQATLMAIDFEARSGPIAAAVVNRYVTIILQENVQARTDRAENTLEFFQVEVERLGNELAKQSAAIVAFNNANSDALPSTLQFRLSQQTTLQARVQTLEQTIDSLRQQKQKLIEVFEATGQVGAQTQNLTPAQQQLKRAQDALNQALAIYSPNNPRVKMLENQLAQAEIAVQQEAGITGTQSPSSILDVQLAALDAQIEVNQEQLVQTEEQLAALNDSIERTPKVQIELDALTRDYQNTQQQYNQATNGLAQASAGERIELLAKGRRIAVIDPATVPSEPARPNRMLIALGGSAFGAFLGIALIAGLEFMNASIRRAADITKKLGITPIATVPYIRTPMEMVVRRAAFTAAFLIFVVGVPAALYAVHTYYLPLDLLYERIAAKVATIL